MTIIHRSSAADPLVERRRSPTGKRHRILSGTLAALALAFTGFIASAVINTPMAHAASCYADGCTGQDPAASGCSADAITVQTIWIGGVSLDQRYSKVCNANWARLNNAPVGWHVTEHNNLGESEDTTSFGQSSTWTAMVDGEVQAWACFDNGYCTTPQ